MSGQKDNRRERLHDTAEWLNAIPVDSNKRPLVYGQDRVDPALVDHEVAAIRTALASGVDNVECFVSSAELSQAVMSQLTENELAHTSFPGMETRV